MPFIGDIGIPGLLIILIIALIVIGPGKLPEVGSALGRGIREFRNASTDLTGDAPKNATPSTSDTAAMTSATPVAVAESPDEQLARLTRERDQLAAELAAAKAGGTFTRDEGAKAT